LQKAIQNVAGHFYCCVLPLHLQKQGAMRFILLSVVTVLLLSCNDNKTEQQNTQAATAASTVQVPSKHTAAFNRDVQSAMSDYYKMTEAFVNWDSAQLPAVSARLAASLDRVQSTIQTDSLGQEAQTHLTAAQKQTAAVAKAANITSSRHAFNALTDAWFSFLKSVQYDRQKLYLQLCPMAFNDTEPGIWISAQDSIRNPYLGLHHPYYKSGMLECGENKEVLDFVGK
jgi:hypothetical protein